MRYSIILPYYDPEHRFTDVTLRCLDGIIKYSTDYEILLKEGTSPPEQRMNEAIRQAQGEYVVITSNDNILLDKDWQSKMALPGIVTCSAMMYNSYTNRKEPETPFCIPREIFEKVGLFDESYAGHYGFTDTDFFHRVRLAGIEIRETPIRYEHQGSPTWDTYFPNEKSLEYNKNIFFMKWPELSAR